MLKMLDDYYQKRTITVTSADPPYITPYIKSTLRRKNRLMRSGHVDNAAALAKKVGRAIQNCRTLLNGAKLMFYLTPAACGRRFVNSMVEA